MKRLLTALTFLTLMLAAAPARADESDFPSVTINTIRSKGRCWDGSPGCFRPDFFVVVRLRNARGEKKCRASPVIEELLFSSPNVTLCNPVGAPATPPITIRGPYSVIVELWDADGNPAPGSPRGTPSTTEIAEQGDLNFGLAMDASIGPFNFAGPSRRAFVIDGPDALIFLTVDTTPVPSNFTVGPSLSATTIDPAIDEDVEISGRLDDPTPLTISATEINTGDATVIAKLDATDKFNHRWDGRRTPGGKFMPVGHYRIDVVGRSGPKWSSSPLALAPKPLLTFGSPRLETPFRVNVRAIFPRVSVSVPELTEITMQVERRSSSRCGGAVLQKISFPSLMPGRHVLEWDGQTSVGTWAPAGPICLRLIGRRVSDNAGYAGTPTITMDVEEQRPLFVDVRASPEIPARSPGGPVRVVARVFDDLGAPRPARFIRVSAGNFPSFGSPLTFLGFCTETSECSIALPSGIAFGTAALSAQAEDARAELITFSSLRLVDLFPIAGSDIRVSVAATSDGSTIVETPRRRAIDIVFHHSIDFRPDDPTSPSFPAVFGQHMDAILGYGFPGRGPSIMEASLPSTNFWAVATPATVEHTKSVATPDVNLCRITSASWSNSADVNGVIHLQNCRDNAPSGAYSAKADSPRISWHELHHTPFDLADEYCCDGGYWQAASFPNVYRSLNDCQSFGSARATCRMISKQILVGTVPTTVSAPWFVSDPNNDVMNSNYGRQNADDARKVRARYFTCTAGGC